MEPPPNGLLLTAVLVLTLAMCSFSAKNCPNCGTTPVPYPFSTDTTCGDPQYKIKCSSGTLLFDTLNTSYLITSINPSNQRLVIQPASLLPNTCVASDFIYEGIKLNDSLPFNITSGNTIMLLNCTDSMLRSPLNCTSTSLCHVYVNSTRGKAPCQAASICCSYGAGGSTTAYWIRIRETGCRAYTSFVDLDPDLAVDKWPNPGLAIHWKLPQEPICRSQVDCDRNSSCGLDPNSSRVRRCYCMGGLQWDPIQGICAQNAKCGSGESCGGSTKTALIAGLTSGIGATLLLLTISMLIYKRHRRIKEAQERLAREREAILNSGGNRTAKIFTGKQITKATNNFSKDRLLGAGGYGEVYKGILEDGTLVAVKCAKLGNAKGTDQVLNEVRILCQVNHRNLVQLLGCCVELQQPILVYEYIQNGTLLDHLQSPKQAAASTGKGQLSWLHRLQIASDTANSLAYLHFSAVPPIYHRDIKPSNILLDEKLNAKVSDFGLSRLAQPDSEYLTHISTCAQGTIGYLDPEYYKNYQLTDKSDVYSFGVVLLELLTSQRAIDFSRPEDEVNLVVYAQGMTEKDRLMDIIDPKLKRETSNNLQLETMKALAFLALNCTEEKRQNRPSMKEVAEEIEYIMTIATSKELESSLDISTKNI